MNNITWSSRARLQQTGVWAAICQATHTLPWDKMVIFEKIVCGPALILCYSLVFSSGQTWRLLACESVATAPWNGAPAPSPLSVCRPRPVCGNLWPCPLCWGNQGCCLGAHPSPGTCQVSVRPQPLPGCLSPALPHCWMWGRRGTSPQSVSWGGAQAFPLRQGVSVRMEAHPVLSWKEWGWFARSMFWVSSGCKPWVQAPQLSYHLGLALLKDFRAGCVPEPKLESEFSSPDRASTIVPVSQGGKTRFWTHRQIHSLYLLLATVHE